MKTDCQILRFDLSAPCGTFKRMNAVNNGPVHKRHAGDQYMDNLELYRAAKIPFARNHDAAFCADYGGEFTVDISAVFPRFEADVSLVLLAKGKATGAAAPADFRLSKKLLVCGLALAVAVFVINQPATLSTALVSPVVLFAFINGGGTIIATVVAAVLYREKLTVSSVAGVLLGIASLVCIKLF